MNSSGWFSRRRPDQLSDRTLVEEFDGAYVPSSCPVSWCDRDPIQHGALHQGRVWQTIAPSPPWRGGINMTMQAVLVGAFPDETQLGFTIIEGTPTLPQASIICEWTAVDGLAAAIEHARRVSGMSG